MRKGTARLSGGPLFYAVFQLAIKEMQKRGQEMLRTFSSGEAGKITAEHTSLVDETFLRKKRGT